MQIVIVLTEALVVVVANVMVVVDALVVINLFTSNRGGLLPLFVILVLCCL